MEHQAALRSTGLRYPTGIRNRVLSHPAHQPPAIKEAELNPGRFNFELLGSLRGMRVFATTLQEIVNDPSRDFDSFEDKIKDALDAQIAARDSKLKRPGFSSASFTALC